MRNARWIGPAFVAVVLAASACHKASTNEAQEQTMAIDEGIPQNQLAGNADIETLPADESSATPSNQLENGFDNPDVNDVTSSSSH